MAYSLEIAESLSGTLNKLVTLNRYQFAGQFANFDFWAQEVKHALEVIDGYPKRRRKLEEAEKKYINDHNTSLFAPNDLTMCNEGPHLRAKPDRTRIDTQSLALLRREVVDSFYRFLVRCHKEQLLRGTDAKQALADCGIGVEPGDFRDDSDQPFVHNWR